MGDATASDDFDRADNSAVGGLGTNWTQRYTTSPGAGKLGIKDNEAFWYKAGTTANECLATYITGSESDYQVVQIAAGQFYQYPFLSDAPVIILARVGDSGTTYVRVTIAYLEVTFSAVVNGVEVWSKTQSVTILATPASVWTFIVGTSATTSRQYRLLLDGFDVMTATDPDVSRKGASYRGWGFGVGVASGVGTQFYPMSTVEAWAAWDNTDVTKSGFLSLTNRGTETVFPKYLCYGPGTFYIGNGSGAIGAAGQIVFGPLLPGQIALLDTDPRRRGVIDISPGQAPGPVSLQDQFTNALYSLSTSANIAPLLTVFASLFGIVPVQGPLYSKLSGRFTRPIVGHVDGTPLVTEQVAVTITGGNADSKIVGAITPLRRWPE
jgi:hypothetical protein